MEKEGKEKETPGGISCLIGIFCRSQYTFFRKSERESSVIQLPR